MFAADRWARAFTGVFGTVEEAEEGLVLLKALSGSLAGIPCMFSGFSASPRLEKMLRRVLAGAENTAASEKVCRFLVLLVRRGRYRYLDGVIRAIEAILDKKQGILPVGLDSAFPL